jgi:hypothetical protein
MSEVYTYNPEKVIVALGSHIASGYADDSFITVEPSGDGTTMKVGCDGSVNRSVSPNRSYSIKVALQQNSPTNEFLMTQYEKDVENGNGTFPIVIKDLMGDEQFSTDVAWVTKPASWGRGKEATNREWELACGTGKFTNS